WRVVRGPACANGQVTRSYADDCAKRSATFSAKKKRRHSERRPNEVWCSVRLSCRAFGFDNCLCQSVARCRGTFGRMGPSGRVLVHVRRLELLAAEAIRQ